jgi:hypothetical protein
VKHAGADALDDLGCLLAQLRLIPGLKEKIRGVFYFGSRACVHFHQDVTGLWADVRLPGETDFSRLPADGTTALTAVLARLEGLIAL